MIKLTISQYRICFMPHIISTIIALSTQNCYNFSFKVKDLYNLSTNFLVTSIMPSLIHTCSILNIFVNLIIIKLALLCHKMMEESITYEFHTQTVNNLLFTQIYSYKSDSNLPTSDAETNKEYVCISSLEIL